MAKKANSIKIISSKPSSNISKRNDMVDKSDLSPEFKERMKTHSIDEKDLKVIEAKLKREKKRITKELKEINEEIRINYLTQKEKEFQLRFKKIYPIYLIEIESFDPFSPNKEEFDLYKLNSLTEGIIPLNSDLDNEKDFAKISKLLQQKKDKFVLIDFKQIADVGYPYSIGVRLCLVKNLGSSLDNMIANAEDISFSLNDLRTTKKFHTHQKKKTLKALKKI